MSHCLNINLCCIHYPPISYLCFQVDRFCVTIGIQVAPYSTLIMTPELKRHDGDNFLNRICVVCFSKFSKSHVAPACGNVGGVGAQRKEERCTRAALKGTVRAQSLLSFDCFLAPMGEQHSLPQAPSMMHTHLNYRQSCGWRPGTE